MTGPLLDGTRVRCGVAHGSRYSSNCSWGIPGRIGTVVTSANRVFEGCRHAVGLCRCEIGDTLIRWDDKTGISCSFDDGLAESVASAIHVWQLRPLGCHRRERP